MANVYLAHHGILGQKWGVRRYQNADGTLTDLGSRRKAQAERAVTPGKDGKASPAEKVTRSTKDIATESGNIVRTAGNMKNRNKEQEDLSKIDDAELRRRINRLDMEQRYSNLKQSQVSKGQRNVEDALSIAGSVLAIGASAAAIATAIYTIKKG